MEVRRVEESRVEAQRREILACHFFVWFVHGLELLQQAGGGEDVGRSWG